MGGYITPIIQLTKTIPHLTVKKQEKKNPHFLLGYCHGLCHKECNIIT